MATSAGLPANELSTSRTGQLLWARLASLLAIVPLGVWVVVHLWNNLAAFSGADAWQKAVTGYEHPVAMLVSLLLSILPLLLHTVWGLQRLATSKPNNLRYSYYGNLKYLLQRVSALGVLGFLAAHIWRAFLRPHLLEGHPEAFQDIAGDMHNNLPTLVVYLLGTLGVAFHLANGISGFCWTFGLTAGRTSVTRVDRVALLVFLVLLAMSWGIIYALWSAGAAG